MSDVPVIARIGICVGGSREPGLVSRLCQPGTGLVVARRCADITELAALARAGLINLAIIGTDTSELDLEAVAALRGRRVRVILFDTRPQGQEAPKAREGAFEDLQGGNQSQALADPERLGADAVTAHPEMIVDLAQLVVEGPPTPPLDVQSLQTAERPQPALVTGRGRVVAVWGTAGAPGRSTVSELLAAVTARENRGVLLLDLDTQAPSQQVRLSLPAAPATVASACALASGGRLDPGRLSELIYPVKPGFSVLPSVESQTRWGEISAPAVREVIGCARKVFDWTVLDLDAGPARSEEGGRFEVTSAALECADSIVVVGGCDPVGVSRLVRRLGEIFTNLDGGSATSHSGAEGAYGYGREPGYARGESDLSRSVCVVVNNYDSARAGVRGKQTLERIVAQYSAGSPLVFIPRDSQAIAHAQLQGRALAATSPGAASLLASLKIVEILEGQTPQRSRRRRWRSTR